MSEIEGALGGHRHAGQPRDHGPGVRPLVTGHMRLEADGARSIAKTDATVGIRKDLLAGAGR